MFHDWSICHLGHLLDRNLFHCIGNFVFEMRRRHLFRDLGSIRMRTLCSGYLSAHLWHGLVLELCLGELLRLHEPIGGHGSLLGWHVCRCCVKHVFKLRHGLLLGNGSVELYELWFGHLPIEHGINKLYELCRWKLLCDHGTVRSHDALLGRHLLVIGCELVFKLRGRDLRAELRHFDLFLMSGWILCFFFGKQRLCELRRRHLSSAHRSTRLHALPLR